MIMLKVDISHFQIIQFKSVSEEGGDLLQRKRRKANDLFPRWSRMTADLTDSL